MYLKQMGQVPLLTRDRKLKYPNGIEDAEAMVQEAHQSLLALSARAQFGNLARKLIEGHERFDG